MCWALDVSWLPLRSDKWLPAVCPLVTAYPSQWFVIKWNEGPLTRILLNFVSTKAICQLNIKYGFYEKVFLGSQVAWKTFLHSHKGREQ